MPEMIVKETSEIETGQALLSVRNVRVAYGESVVVHGANLEVRTGQIVCLMGRNGAGKTSLMKAIIGILPAKSGTIELDGKHIQRWPSYKRARAHVGYVPQGRGIFPYLTVMENITIGLEPVQGRDTGQVEDALTLFPVLKEMANRTAGLLSGGQQQQLAIARALVGRPQLLLLDEPTEGIQPSIVEEIERVVVSLRGQMAVLLVEQFVDFALGVADRCYVMEHGSVVLEGPPASLDERLLKQYVSI